MLATVPGQTAAVFVAFAGIGGIPTNSSAGKERKLPPPATELITPAKKAAINRKQAWPKCTRKNKPDDASSHSVSGSKSPVLSYPRARLMKGMNPRRERQ